MYTNTLGRSRHARRAQNRIRRIQTENPLENVYTNVLTDGLRDIYISSSPPPPFIMKILILPSSSDYLVEQIKNT